MQTKPKAALYCRVASANDAAIRTQEEVLNDYAISDDLETAVTFSDNGASGLTLDRPAFNRMMRDIKSGEIDCVIVKDISRISRSFSLLQDWIEEVAERNIRVIDVSGGLDATEANTRLIRDFLSRKTSAGATASQRLKGG
jgi:DNA invertase Pin-like site-specific DNA recombinase